METLPENVKTLKSLCIYSRTGWFNYLILSFFLSFLISHYQNAPCCLYPNIWIYFTYFYSGASHYSNLWQLLSPPIPTKHPIWYSINADLIITLHGILYGLHCWHFLAWIGISLVKPWSLSKSSVNFDIENYYLHNDFLSNLFQSNKYSDDKT